MSNRHIGQEIAQGPRLDVRLETISGADLEMMLGTERLDATFDNGFDNSFDNSISARRAGADHAS